MVDSLSIVIYIQIIIVIIYIYILFFSVSCARHYLVPSDALANGSKILKLVFSDNFFFLTVDVTDL